ncbi:hypothetical protein POM88_041759 [Heracleum sosnowskyi]|uniref:Uncharacterized protein n=1 Tax=Heracleum sosnowskyi TaxID=360622 RepID=A0AAD8MBM7_9APIA|nr:hypothetical protein POM88_041759 [Heracleum sosnowskyi]
MFLCVLVEDLYDWSFTFPKARIGTLTLRLKTTQLMSWVVKTDGFLLLLLISGLFQRNMCYSTSKQELVINISWHYVFMAIRITRLKFANSFQVAALKQVTQKDLIDFFNEHIKVGAPQKKSLSVRVYGN